MAGHQTVGVENGPIAFPCGLQVEEKSLSIRTPFEDSFPFIAPGGNVIPGSRVVDAQRSSHFEKFTSISLFFNYHFLENLSNVET